MPQERWHSQDAIDCSSHRSRRRGPTCRWQRRQRLALSLNLIPICCTLVYLPAHVRVAIQAVPASGSIPIRSRPGNRACDSFPFGRLPPAISLVSRQAYTPLSVDDFPHATSPCFPVSLSVLYARSPIKNKLLTLFARLRYTPRQ